MSILALDLIPLYDKIIGFEKTLKTYSKTISQDFKNYDIETNRTRKMIEEMHSMNNYHQASLMEIIHGLHNRIDKLEGKTDEEATENI